MPELKKGQVWRLRVDREKYPDFNTWCRDLQYIVTSYTDKTGKEILQLTDTYWGTDGSDFDKLSTFGTMEFRFDFAEVEEIQEHDLDYYADDDIIPFFRQASCRKQWFIKKGTERSKEKMLAVLNERIREARSKIDSLCWNIQKAGMSIGKIEAGHDLNDIYI